MKLFDKVVLGLGGVAVWVAACGGNVVVDTPSGTGTATDTATESGTDTSTDTFSETGTDSVSGTETSTDTVTGSALSCMQCACDMFLFQGGCEDICKVPIDGGTVPNFCDGAPALTMCAACIQMNCLVANPAECM